MLLRPRARRLASGLAVAALPLVVAAQSEAPPAREEVVELSPFVVSAAGDVGYQASNTLSGSRLDARLKDTAATISVFTEEFLRDLGATSTADIIQYGTNTDRDFQAGSANPTLAFLDGGLYTDTRINVRGILASRTTDYFESSLPTDRYNLGRVDLSSGPNSVLFGFANAGGLLNTATKDAESGRSFGAASLTTGSWDLLRAEADVNLALRKDRIGLRVMGLHEDMDGWRTWDYREQQRGTLALQVRPLKNTLVRAHAEIGSLAQHVSRPYNLGDGVTSWFRAGRPLVTNTALTGSTNAIFPDLGIEGNGVRRVYDAATRRWIVPVNGRRATYQYGSTSLYEPNGGSDLPPGRRDVPTSNWTLLPFADPGDGTPWMPLGVSYGGPDSRREASFERQLVRLEQRLGQNTTVELAYNRERSAGTAILPAGDGLLQADPNATVPTQDGLDTSVPNPMAGRLYLDGTYYFNEAVVEQDVLRATASHNLDLGRWGYHRLAAFGESADFLEHARQGPEILVNANGQPVANVGLPENFANWMFRRQYVTEGDFTTYHIAPRVDALPTYAGATQSTRFVSAAPTSIRGDERTIRSFMVADQAYLLDSRLVITAGYRLDDIRFRRAAIGRATADDPRVLAGDLLANEYIILPTAAGFEDYEARTFTAGAVYHLRPWLTAFYNQASNSGPPGLGRLILPDSSIPPLSRGRGRDFGIMLDLLEGKLFGRLTYFETATRNEVVIRDAAVRNAHNRIVDALALAVDPLTGAPYLTAAEREARQVAAQDILSSVESSGVELEVKYNPSKAWATTFSYSFTRNERTDIFQEFDGWYEAQSVFYDAFPADSVVTNQNRTIAQERQIMLTSVENVRNVNGFGFNNRPHKANVFGRYEFQEGRAKGLYLGGGVRYQSPNRVQRELLGFNADGTDILGETLEGRQVFEVDALLGMNWTLKRVKLFRTWGSHLRVQLNVRNVFDNEDPQIIRYNRSGEDRYWRVTAATPRSFRLSASLSF